MAFTSYLSAFFRFTYKYYTHIQVFTRSNHQVTQSKSQREAILTVLKEDGLNMEAEMNVQVHIDNGV